MMVGWLKIFSWKRADYNKGGTFVVVLDQETGWRLERRESGRCNEVN